MRKDSLIHVVTFCFFLFTFNIVQGSVKTSWKIGDHYTYRSTYSFPTGYQETKNETYKISSIFNWHNKNVFNVSDLTSTSFSYHASDSFTKYYTYKYGIGEVINETGEYCFKLSEETYFYSNMTYSNYMVGNFRINETSLRNYSKPKGYDSFLFEPRMILCSKIYNVQIMEDNITVEGGTFSCWKIIMFYDNFLSILNSTDSSGNIFESSFIRYSKINSTHLSSFTCISVEFGKTKIPPIIETDIIENYNETQYISKQLGLIIKVDSPYISYELISLTKSMVVPYSSIFICILPVIFLCYFKKQKST